MTKSIPNPAFDEMQQSLSHDCMCCFQNSVERFLLVPYLWAVVWCGRSNLSCVSPFEWPINPLLDHFHELLCSVFHGPRLVLQVPFFFIPYNHRPQFHHFCPIIFTPLPLFPSTIHNFRLHKSPTTPNTHFPHLTLQTQIISLRHVKC